MFLFRCQSRIWVNDRLIVQSYGTFYGCAFRIFWTAQLKELDSRLERLRSGLQRHIEARFAPGLVGLVGRGDDVETFALGKMALEGGADMRRDSIFRIASMTKPITAAATMMLVDEGKLRLDEPVDRLLPELANRRMLRSIDADVDDTVPAKRPVIIEDLLTFRCGLGMIVAPGSLSHPESHCRARRQRRRLRPGDAYQALA